MIPITRTKIICYNKRGNLSELGLTSIVICGLKFQNMSFCVILFLSHFKLNKRDVEREKCELKP
jgi:hypothetical protein